MPVFPVPGDGAGDSLTVAIMLQLRMPVLPHPPVVIHLSTVDDLRELAYLARDVRHCDGTLEGAIRIVRWLTSPHRHEVSADAESV